MISVNAEIHVPGVFDEAYDRGIQFKKSVKRNNDILQMIYILQLHVQLKPKNYREMTCISKKGYGCI